jgi:integrase
MPLKIYKRGEIYHYRGKVAGRRLRGTTGTANREIAEQIANRAEARAYKSDLHGPETVLRFTDAVATYRKAGKSDRFLLKLVDHFKETLVSKITAGAIRQAAIDLYPNASAATRNRQVIVPTQAIINHCAELEMCPIIRVRRFKVEKVEKIPVTWEWVQKFKANSKPHLGALAMFMFLTGARISEAIAVQWEDVDFKSQTVLIRQTKIGEERRAHLPPELVVALANLKRVKGRGVFWYQSRRHCWMVWMTACKRASIPALSFHACRHGFATAMLRAGHDPVTVAKRGGWKTARHVFETYGHANEDLTITESLTGTQVTQFPSAIQETPVKSS